MSDKDQFTFEEEDDFPETKVDEQGDSDLKFDFGLRAQNLILGNIIKKRINVKIMFLKKERGIENGFSACPIVVWWVKST